MTTWKQKGYVVLGNMFEYYDVACYAVISTYIGALFFPQENQYQAMMMVWGMFALRYLIRPFGGFFIGRYADKYGRKSALVLTSAIIGISTLSIAILPTYHDIGIIAPCLYLILLMLQAFSFGGEYPTIISYLVETTPESGRAKVSSMLVGSCIAGLFLSLSIMAVLNITLTEEQMYAFGWRIPLLVGLINVSMGLYFKLKLTESIHIEKQTNIQLDKINIVQLVFSALPACLAFYIHAISSKLLINSATDDPTTQQYLPLVINFIFALCLLATGWLIDKFSTCEKTYRLGVGMMMFFSIPLYSLLDQGSFMAIVVYELAMTVIACCILAPLAGMLFKKTVQKNRATNLAVGYNIALTLFGGVTPFIVSLLLPHGNIYVGCYCTLACVIYFVFEQGFNRQYHNKLAST